MVQCFICLKNVKIHDDCLTKYLGQWSKYNHFYHCKQHQSSCLVCNKDHSPTSKSTSKRYVHNKRVHYMTDKCATDLNTNKSHGSYMHDTFFDTWCSHRTKFSNWLYHIEKERFQIYLQHIFAQDEYEIMNKKIQQKHLKVRILKLNNIIKLKTDNVICDANIDLCSDNGNDETANVCWANSMIQMIFQVISPFYDDLYKSYVFKIKNEKIDTQNDEHKCHILICHNFFQTFNKYMNEKLGTKSDTLSVDKFIQVFPGYIKDDYEDAFYLYLTLIDALKYGTSTKESVGMHILDDRFHLYYDEYKWCKNCDHTECRSLFIPSIQLPKLESNNVLSSLLNTIFEEQRIDDVTCSHCKNHEWGTKITATKYPTQLMIQIFEYKELNESQDMSQLRAKKTYHIPNTIRRH